MVNNQKCATTAVVFGLEKAKFSSKMPISSFQPEVLPEIARIVGIEKCDDFWQIEIVVACI